MASIDDVTPEGWDKAKLNADHEVRARLSVSAGHPVKLTGITAGRPRPVTTLPESSAERKEYPMLEGVLKYFPAALAGVAQISKIGNDKHNGAGTPLQHSRGLSMDHGDCILRHLMDLFEDRGAGVGYDENGVPQVAYIAWRALALAQEWFEKHEGAPLAPNAKVVPPPDPGPTVAGRTRSVQEVQCP